jgi:hypothetical protein
LTRSFSFFVSLIPPQHIDSAQPAQSQENSTGGQFAATGASGMDRIKPQFISTVVRLIVRLAAMPETPSRSTPFLPHQPILRVRASLLPFAVKNSFGNAAKQPISGIDMLRMAL